MDITFINTETKKTFYYPLKHIIVSSKDYQPFYPSYIYNISFYIFTSYRVSNFQKFWYFNSVLPSLTAGIDTEAIQDISWIGFLKYLNNAQFPFIVLFQFLLTFLFTAFYRDYLQIGIKSKSKYIFIKMLNPVNLLWMCRDDQMEADKKYIKFYTFNQARPFLSVVITNPMAQ